MIGRFKNGDDTFYGEVSGTHVIGKGDYKGNKFEAYFYDDETLKREVDRILLKIRIRGKESLSSEELQILQEASIRFGNR